MLLRHALTFALVMALAGCKAIDYKPMVPVDFTDKPRKIVIFFDGTHNNPSSDTNVKKLHSLVTLQDRKSVASLYIDGVGVGSDVAGMSLGLGVKARVRIAYEFLLANHREKDEIYIFGFSRGAYQARILASLLANVGLQHQEGLSQSASSELVYDAFKGVPAPGETRREMALKERKRSITCVLEALRQS